MRKWYEHLVVKIHCYGSSENTSKFLQENLFIKNCKLDVNCCVITIGN